MRPNFYLSGFLILAFLTSGGLFASAQEGVSKEINELNQTISQKKQSIDQINRRIGEYKKKIEQKQAEKASLAVELELLDNRIAKTQLEIEETGEEIDLLNSEISLLKQQLDTIEEKLNQDRQLMAGVLQKIQVKDQEMPLEVLFGSDSIADLFDEAHALQTINTELKRTLEKAKESKDLLEEKKIAQQVKRDQMEAMERDLEKEEFQLQEEVTAQETLIVQTQRSEDAFRELMQALKEEQQFINREIAALQKEIEGKLGEADQGGATAALSWPIDPSIRGISATFQDPTYPYRHLFEHSGVDLPATKGTAVKSAASGYVAWARRGRLYGNYVMIIHSNGIATLYAHLSRIDVQPDQFVSRGSVIGAVGNTGLSTGSHLHFEVRKEGIPTNPIDYLMAY